MSLPGGTVSPSRLHALQHLERVASTDAYVGQLGGEGGDDRERRQALDLVAGVTRWQRRLDFILSEFYNGDFEDVERRLQIILRLGLYELLYQETPSHAAVDQYVELAKQTIRPGAGGLVNGILRSVNRQRDDLPEPDTGDRAEDLAIHHSHPTWMARRWMERYGEEDAVALMQWNNLRPVYGVRVDTRRTTVDAVTDALDAEDVTWARSHYLTDFLRLKKLQEVVRGPLLEEGHVAVQDESAGLVVRCLNPQPGETVLDLCAAPGGKALYAAMRMEGEGTVRAYDVHEGRLGLVEEAADRHGLSGTIRTTPADARDLPTMDDPPEADRVLVDVPCSGLGVLSKRADLRWQRTPDDLNTLTELQAEILDAAASLVRPGGRLVYSTCTIEPEENQALVDAFLEHHPEFEREPIDDAVPQEMITPAGDFASLPHRDEVDGAYACRLRRRGSTSSTG